MSKKVFYAIATTFVLASALFFDGFVSAKNDSDYELPEIEGAYDVPGHSKMKLRVFVYRAKPEDATTAEKAARPGAVVPNLTCGLPDMDSLEVVSPAGWRLANPLTYNVNLESVPLTIGAANANILIERSYTVWATALNGKVSFVRGNNTTVSSAMLDGRNIVTWGRTSLTALAVTYVWYDTQTKEAVEIDTIMNKKFMWYWADQVKNPGCAYSGVYDAQNILIHELGHTVGLGDEYDSVLYSDSTMYGFGSKTEVKKDTLTAGDLVGANKVYGY